MGQSQLDVNRQEQQDLVLCVRQEHDILLTLMVQVVQHGVQKPLPICAEVLLPQIISLERLTTLHQSGNRALQAAPNTLQPIQGQGPILLHLTTAGLAGNIPALHQQVLLVIQEAATDIQGPQVAVTVVVPVQPVVLHLVVVTQLAGHHL